MNSERKLGRMKNLDVKNQERKSRLKKNKEENIK
jgi:hypothetical protein